MPNLSASVRCALGAHTDVVVHLYDEIDSTNAEARRHASVEAASVEAASAEIAPALYIARRQTAGRGRLGRDFYSPATGLYMTLAYTTDRPIMETVTVTTLASVAAASAIEHLTDKRPRIKWVNDLYLGGGKLAGILTEAVPLPHGIRVIVGIGINLTTAVFPDGLRAPAASLFAPDEAHRLTDDFTGTLAGEIAGRLLDAVAQPRSRETLPDGEPCLSFYRRHLLYVGERVVCTRGSESFEGTVLGVDEGYSLLLDTAEGIQTLSSGEISVRPKA